MKTIPLKNNSMKVFFAFLCLLLSSMTVVAQNEGSYGTDTLTGAHYDYYRIVEVAPEFPGGTVELMKFLRKNTHYPKEAKKNNIKGIVYASFVIDETGKVSNTRILRGLGYGCDEEALRIIGLMPKWIPAQTKGKPVKCEFNLPIRFGK